MEQNSKEQMKMADPNQAQVSTDKKKTIEDTPAPGEEAAP